MYPCLLLKGSFKNASNDLSRTDYEAADSSSKKVMNIPPCIIPGGATCQKRRIYEYYEYYIYIYILGLSYYQ